MVRAAAKNFKNVTIITNKNDYKALVNELEKIEEKQVLNLENLCRQKAFGLTAYYDAMIANWFNRNLDIKFPERKTIFGRKLNNLRYGESTSKKFNLHKRLR